MNNPKVSFIIPVYNVAMYLEACIESVLAQSLRDIEILLIDDGSTDGSSDICDEYADKDGRIHVVHQHNNGVSAARNTGISLARGEWICFVDGDDIVASQYAQYVETYKGDNDILLFLSAKEKELLAVRKPAIYDFSKYEIQGFQCATLNKYQKEKTSRLVYKQLNPTSACIKAYRSKWLVEHNLSFPRGVISGEDTFFNLLAFGEAERVRVVYAPVYYYRDNQRSVTKRYNPNLKDNFQRVSKLIEEYVVCRERAELRETLSLYEVSTFMFIALQDFCHPQNPKAFRERKRQFLALRENPLYAKAFREAKIQEFSRSKACVCRLCKYHQFELLCFLNCLRVMCSTWRSKKAHEGESV